MQFYQTPIKSRSAATLSFLLGVVAIAAIVLATRLREIEARQRNSAPISETIPVDPSLVETQESLSREREKKLGTVPGGQKTVTETKPVTTTRTVPVQQSPATQKQSDRTTRTS